MSVEKIVQEMFRCTCEREECAYIWTAETVPVRCPKCKSRRWNRKARISRSKPLTFNGETHTIAEWGRKFGFAKTTIPWRISQGWPMEQVLSAEDWRYQKTE